MRRQEDNRLYISDSNHDQIVVADLAGDVLDRIGTGRAGHGDGGFDVAEFRKPQGLAWVQGRLWVADTNNHAIRAVNARTGVVTTVHVRQPQSHRDHRERTES